MKKPSAETVVFAVAMACVGALLVWWTVFFRRVTRENFELQSRLLAFRNDQIEPGMRALQEQFDRNTRMVVGEGSTFALCLLACVIALFLVARQRQIAKDRMERMLALTTHELKTPIAGVRALLQSLERGSVPEEARARLLAHGVRECDRLEHLSETILAYQRALRSEPARWHDAFELVKRVLEHRGEFVDEGARPDGLQVWADGDSFRVITENLLDNAVKYGGGTPPRITYEHRGTEWRFSVSDKGVGFVPGESERLFDVFARGPGTSGQHGSGLGLYIARQLAAQMNGSLQASSEGPGRGATFTLTLKSQS